MERWEGRVALVTGASAGIGAATVKKLVQSGMTVIGIARNINAMEEMKNDFSDYTGEFYPLKCDISNKEEIEEAFKWATENVGGVDVLINNAGYLEISSLLEDCSADLKQMFDVNVFALVTFTRIAINSMKERGIEDGTIINLNSIAGHDPAPKDILETGYYASKHAALILTHGIKNELYKQNSSIRIINISPAAVKTAMLAKELEEDVLNTYPSLSPEEVANLIISTLILPPHIEIQDATIRHVKDDY